MRIKVIMPITSDVFDEEIRREFRSYAGPGVEFDVQHLDYGPASIESEYDEALAVPDILNKVQNYKRQSPCTHPGVYGNDGDGEKSS